jgi:hypothetical protein
VPRLPKALSAALLSATLAIAIAACGSGSSTTTASPEASSTPSATSTTPAPSSQATTPQPSTPTTQQGTQGSGESQGSSQTPENSIKDYGSSASSAQKAALASAAFAFFKAMAASDYAKVCNGITAANRKELQAFTKAKHQSSGCPSILKMLISTRGVPEAKKAAAGKLISVRVKGDTAFVIFAPKGGKPSYFVLKREAGAWKAIGLAPGTPLNPLAGGGK